MGFNHSKLRGKIKEIYGTQKAFSKALGISNTSLSAKLNNQIDFNQSEIAIAVQLLGISNDVISEYFFCSKSPTN